MSGFFETVGAVITAIFAVLTMLLVGMDRIRKLIAGDVMAQLASCKDDHAKAQAQILSMTGELAGANTRIHALERIMREYLQPIGGRQRKSDQDQAVGQILEGDKKHV